MSLLFIILPLFFGSVLMDANRQTADELPHPPETFTNPALVFHDPGDTIYNDGETPANDADTPDQTPADTPDQTPADTPDQTPADTLQEPPVDEVEMPQDTAEAVTEPGDEEQDRIREREPVDPLTVYTPSAFREISDDSLTRWELWSDLGERISRMPGVVSFQLGGQGRNDGFLIHGHESRHQRLYRDGIPVNERIFGSANHKRLPHYSRIASLHDFTGSIRYRSEVNTRRYHVTRPLTLINYEQTTFDYRSTEGYVTRNFTPSTNLSLAYWGKNEDEGYRNRFMGGRNVGITLYHYLNNTWMLEGGYHYSGLQFGEPHGYQIADMFTFHFDRFHAVPYQSQAESSMRNSLFRLTAYHRQHPDEKATSRISVYHDRYRRSHYDNSDSSFVRTHTTGIAGRHIRIAGPFELQGDFNSEWSVIDRDRYQTMDADSWGYTEGKGMVTLPLPNRSKLHTWLQSGWRTDGFVDYEIGSKADFRLTRSLSAYGSYARGEQMPRPGHLYWNRPPVRGDTDLQNEGIQRAEIGLQYRSGSWHIGGEIHASSYERPILVDGDSTFARSGAYTSAGATGWLSHDGDRFEFSLSGTFQQYLSDDPRIPNQLLDLSGQRAWTRASFYYKNYIYDRASYMKTGFYIQASPTAYRSARYYPSMDYWDPNSWHPGQEFTEAQALPEFVRVDLDLTARVRSAIFLFRLENALDNWLLPGYFETAYQPMPSMRLRFGVRWVLRN